MSGTGSSSSSVTPFTVSQWHELEHQALIFKYLKAGHPVPPDLLVPIRTSLKFLSSSLFHHPTLGYCSYFGKKIDPEPGRCRRTDGKKWRCSKDAHLNSKYCERHMNRSRSRSRKPVESQNTSQSLSTVGLDIATGSSRGSGSGGGSLIFQKPPLHSVGTREGICFRSNMSLSHMDHIPYGIPNKEYSGQDRCLQELKPETDNCVLSVASESLRGFTMNSSLDSARRVTTSGSSSNPLSDQRDFFLQNSCLPMQMQQDFDLLMANDATSKQQQQHYFFGREFDSSRPLKQEHQSLQPLPNELPKTIDFGCYLDDQRANKNSLSTTQLSLPTPLASSKFFERSVHSSKDNFMDKFLS